MRFRGIGAATVFFALQGSPYPNAALAHLR